MCENSGDGVLNIAVVDNLSALLEKGVRLSIAASAFDLDVDTAARIAVHTSVDLAKRPPPPELTCPITTDLFMDPVVASDSFTYERHAIEEHLKHKKTSPSTNQPLTPRGLMPAEAVVASQTVKGLVVDWLEDRSVLATYALKRIIDSGDVDGAQEFIDKCSLWIDRFPAKRLLTFREIALRIPMYGEPFKVRETAFMSTAAAVGMNCMEAFLKHHELSCGYCRYGYYGSHADLPETWTLQRDSLVITTLLPACSWAVAYRVPFSFDLQVGGEKFVPTLHSQDFDVRGMGTCYVRLFGEDDAIRACLCVRTPAPPEDLCSLLVSIRREGGKTTFYWRERGRKAHDGVYDVRVHDIDSLSEGLCEFSLEIVARSLSGPAIEVPVLPKSETYDRLLSTHEIFARAELSPRNTDCV